VKTRSWKRDAKLMGGRGRMKKSYLAMSVLLLLTKSAMAESPLSIRELPREVEKVAQDLVAECKEAGQEIDGNLEKTLRLHKLGSGKRLVVFDPKRICAFKGNAVCSTDGCDTSIYVEFPPNGFTLATKQTVLGDVFVEDAQGSKPLKVVMELRGGNPPCKRSPQSTCKFELTWRGLNFEWRNVR
jgi:hypothetical protein